MAYLATKRVYHTKPVYWGPLVCVPDPSTLFPF